MTFYSLEKNFPPIYFLSVVCVRCSILLHIREYFHISTLLFLTALEKEELFQNRFLPKLRGPDFSLSPFNISKYVKKETIVLEKDRR